MMNIPRTPALAILRSILIATACALVAACAGDPPRQSGMDYRSDPPPPARSNTDAPGSSGQRLTIQSGEGERLNLPWFIRDTQDWINNQ